MSNHPKDLLDLVSAFGEGVSVDCAIRCAINLKKNGGSECAAKVLQRYADHHGYNLDAIANQILEQEEC